MDFVTLVFSWVEIKEINFSVTAGNGCLNWIVFPSYNMITEDTFNTDLNKRQLMLVLIKDQETTWCRDLLLSPINPRFCSEMESHYNRSFFRRHNHCTCITGAQQVMKYGWCKAVGEYYCFRWIGQQT